MGSSGSKPVDAAAALKLQCEVRKYHWGKVGATSKVAALSSAGNPAFQLDPAEKYAELWMGTHVKSPSYFIDAASGERTSLLAHVQAHPELLTDKLAARYGAGSIPFLFKVLSIQKALSIQAHPDKKLAEKLHAQDPEHYPDPNHKPEMTIALTDFKGLCGFRPAAELASHLKAIPELAAIVGDAGRAFAAAVEAGKAEAELKEGLKGAFTALMKAAPETVKAGVETMAARISAAEASKRSALEALFLTLNEQYPGDGGCFCIFFLNVVQLNPGDAMFLGANEPHAYLEGDCVECMACSDNVVRAGLTPKFKDVDNLCEMLTYSMKSAQDQVFQGSKKSDEIRLFDTPVDDFTVAAVEVEAGKECVLPAVAGPCITLVTEGEGTIAGQSFGAGTVLFFPPSVDIPLAATAKSKLFCAFCDK